MEEGRGGEVKSRCLGEEAGPRGREMRMEKKTLSFVVIGLGIIIFLVSLLADLIGIGGSPDLGYKQIIGIVVGVIIGIIGFVLHRKWGRMAQAKP